MKADEFILLSHSQLREALWAGEHERFSPLEDETRLRELAHELNDFQAEFVLTLYAFRGLDVPVGLLRSFLRSDSRPRRLHSMAALSRFRQLPTELMDRVQEIKDSATSIVEKNMASRLLTRYGEQSG